MSNVKHPPILNMNGSSFQDLYDQYSAAYHTLLNAEEAARKAMPHGRDYQCAPEPGRAARARDEYHAEVLAKINDAKNYVHDLLLCIMKQRDDRDARRAPRPVTGSPAVALDKNL